jgi:hypothetical protein
VTPSQAQQVEPPPPTGASVERRIEPQTERRLRWNRGEVKASIAFGRTRTVVVTTHDDDPPRTVVRRAMEAQARAPPGPLQAGTAAPHYCTAVPWSWD